jgi:hypothetical protein
LNVFLYGTIVGLMLLDWNSIFSVGWAVSKHKRRRNSNLLSLACLNPMSIHFLTLACCSPLSFSFFCSPLFTSLWSSWILNKAFWNCSSEQGRVWYIIGLAVISQHEPYIFH